MVVTGRKRTLFPSCILIASLHSKHCMASWDQSLETVFKKLKVVICSRGGKGVLLNMYTIGILILSSSSQ